MFQKQQKIYLLHLLKHEWQTLKKKPLFAANGAKFIKVM